VRSKGQLNVTQDTQRHDFSGYLNVSASHCDLLALNLGELKRGAKTDELRFVFIKFQALLSFYTCHQLQNFDICLHWVGRKIQLTVVSIRMYSETTTASNGNDVSAAIQKKYRPENTALSHSTCQN